MATTTRHDEARNAGRTAALLYFQAEAARLVATLTPEEADILKLIASGRTNAQIAELLNLGTTAVWSRRASIFAKLGVERAEQASVIAAKGLLV